MRFGRLSTAFIVSAVCTLGFVQSAFAWGSCGRGPWVTYGESWCSCGNGQEGYGYEGGAGVFVEATGGPSNGWVAFEYEGYDEDGNRIFIPAATYAWWDYQAIYAIAGTSYQAYSYHWPWASGYSYTGRYRSVCMTNYTNFNEGDEPFAY
jgi:hypothetical protein